MNAESLVTYTQAAIRLKTDRWTIAGLVKALNIPTYPFPSNGRAIGVNAADLSRLALALGQERPSVLEPETVSVLTAR